ncbi:MAG: response regulator transcription factor [Betaproteobacteria bacterium]|nr:response regulator transcription factor [Betaproteobacteria bacterium]
MSTDTSTVFIIDDEPAIRDSLTLMIRQEGITVKTYDSGKAFLAAHHEGSLGCAIVDVKMPDMDGLQLQEYLARKNIQLPIIFLTGHGDIPMSVRAIKAGAVDFLTKPVTREKLLTAIHSALNEAKRILSENANHQHAETLLAGLTERERDVMLLAIQGHHNKEIARLLEISHRTVEIHKSKIMHKTGAMNLLDLARLAHDGGVS